MYSNIASQIQKDGFIVLRNFLDKNELNLLRDTIKNHFKTKGIVALSGLTKSNAAVEVSEINWLFYHPKILNIMDKLIKPEKIMFTSHCDVHSNTLTAWHKDDGMAFTDGGYFGKPTYDELNCCVYKVGIYLQDHVYNRGGLTVRKGSHRFSSLDCGEEVYLKTRVGDVVIFDVRLTHTGQRDAVPIPALQKPLRLIKRLTSKLGKVEGKKIDNFARNIYNQIFGDRQSIFFTYGANNEYTKKFAVGNMKRQILQNNSKNIFLQSSTRQSLLDNNVYLAEDAFEELLCKRAN